MSEEAGLYTVSTYRSTSTLIEYLKKALNIADMRMIQLFWLTESIVYYKWKNDKV